MGKSRRFGNDQSFKSHRDKDKKFIKKHIKSGWSTRQNDTDRDINRRIHQGYLDEDEY